MDRGLRRSCWEISHPRRAQNSCSDWLRAVGFAARSYFARKPWVIEDRCASAGEGGGGVGEQMDRRANNSLSFVPNPLRDPGPCFWVFLTFPFSREINGDFSWTAIYVQTRKKYHFARVFSTWRDVGSVLGWLSSLLAVLGRCRASPVRAKPQESKADALATESWWCWIKWRKDLLFLDELCKQRWMSEEILPEHRL